MTRTPLSTTLDALRGLVRHRQPDPVRRGDPAPGRRAVPGGRRRPRRAAGQGRLEAGAEGLGQHPPPRPRGERARRRHRRHRVDAHVQPGEDVDRRARRAAEAAAAPAHAGERRAALGGHRLRLHEPQPGRARRPRVRLHPDPPRRRPQDRRRARVEPGRAPAGRGLAARRGRVDGIPHPQARPLRRQHALRRRHRGRQDRSRAAVRRAGQHLGRQRARRSRGRPRHPPTSTRSWPSTWSCTTCRRAALGAASATSRCATAPRSSWGCARSSRRAGSAPSPRPSRTSAR